MNRVCAMYFSPTRTTKKIVIKLSEKIAELSGVNEVEEIDFTVPSGRLSNEKFTGNDIVVFGVPVYAGRVPNILLKYLDILDGCGAKVVPVVLYGNRNYDDALIELSDILKSKNFKVVGAGAFVGEHSFSKILAKDRPDENDINFLNGFAKGILENYSSLLDGSKGEEETYESLSIKGNKPYRPYYRPINPQGESVDIRKVKPKTSEKCNDCKICVGVCPMGSIEMDDVSIVSGICIKCGACEKICPVGAKYYDDENYIRHKVELEIDCIIRREPELFI